MFEKVIEKLASLIEIIGLVFLNKLDNVRASNSELIEEIATRKPSFSLDMPSSAIIDKIFDYLSPEKFNFFRLFSVIGIVFVLGVIFSFIPILYPYYHVLAVLLFLAGIALIGIGGKLTEHISINSVKSKLSYELMAGLFILGLIGIIANFVRVGIPLFEAELRAYYHNQLWSFSFILYMIGMMGVYIKNKDAFTFNLLFVLGLLIALLSGFRTDFILFLGPLVLFKYLKGEFDKTKTFYIVFFFLFFVIAIRYSLLVFSSLQPSFQEILSSDILFGKVGLNFYVLSIFIYEGGLTGVGGGMLSLGKFFFQQFSIPSLEFGAVGADLVINYARHFESSLVGPTYLDMGIPGVLVFMSLLGFFTELPKRIYRKLKDDLFLGLYGIQVSIMLVWIQTGLVQYYLFFLFFIIGIYCLVKTR